MIYTLFLRAIALKYMTQIQQCIKCFFILLFLSFIGILDINHVIYIAFINCNTTFFILDITGINLQIMQVLHARHKERRIEYKEYLWQRMQY